MGLLGIGGSKQSSSSQSASQSVSSSQDSVFLQQLFQQLFGGASNVAGSIDTSGLTKAANQLFSSGTGFLGELETLSEGAGGYDSASIAPGAGEDYLTGRGSGVNPLLAENISGLEADLGKFFNEKLLPGI